MIAKDICDIPDTELRELYAEYLNGIGRPVPCVTHRQDRSTPGVAAPSNSTTGLTSTDFWANAGHLVEYGEVKPEEIGG